MTVTAIEPSPVYELRQVSKTYARGAVQVAALRAVDLVVDAGEFVAVVGPSGSGKTTLLQLLGGLDRPSSGEILLDGRDLSRLPDRELTRLRLETIGFVFQQFNLIPTLTASQNIEAALAPRRLAGRDRHRRAHDLLEAVGLESRAGHLPSQLSGGEQQRVAVARALANEPRVILADEPTGNLDSASGEEIVGLLGSLSRERGETVVLITHDPDLAARASRILRLQDGAVAGGDPAARASRTFAL